MRALFFLLFNLTVVDVCSQVIYRDMDFGQNSMITYGKAVSLQNGQNILAVETRPNGGYAEPLLLKYLPSGELDLSFSDDGIAAIPVGPYRDCFDRAAVQPDGKIVAAGVSHPGTSDYSRDLLVCRFNENGSIDSTFDFDGKVINHFSVDKLAITEVFIQPADSYQWFLDGEPLSGETDDTLEITQAGTYSVLTEDVAGCVNISDTAFYDLLPFAFIENSLKDEFAVFPNPVDDHFILKTDFSDITEVEISDFSGKLVEIKKFNQQTHEINVKNYAPGVYFLSFTSGNEVYQLKFIKK